MEIYIYVHMISKNLSGNRDDESFGACQHRAFQTRDLFQKMLIMDNNVVINQTTAVRPIPLSGYKCSNNTRNCCISNLGKILLGQTIRVELTNK